MCHDQTILAGGLLHCAAHHRRILHAAAIIRKGDAPALQCGHIYRFQTGTIARDGGIGEDIYHRIAVNDGLLDSERFRCIRGGVEIRHGANRRITTARSSQRTGADGLLLRKAGLTEVNVHIHQPRDNQLSICLQNGDPVCLEVSTYLCDAAFPNEDIGLMQAGFGHQFTTFNYIGIFHLRTKK